MSLCEITAAIVEFFFFFSRFQRAQSRSGQNVVRDYASGFVRRTLAGGLSGTDFWVTEDV